MVSDAGDIRRRIIGFQYSLCRVVLMVIYGITVAPPQVYLSVLALSSRFDGRSTRWESWTKS